MLRFETQDSMRLRVDARNDTRRRIRETGAQQASDSRKNRPKLVSVKRNEEGERSEDFLFERSEFNVSASRTQSHACMSFAEAQPNFTFGVNLQRADRME